MKGILWKFNLASSCTEEQAKSTKEWALMEKLERGEKPTLGELESCFRELWHPDGYSDATVRLAGWCYDFKPYFRRYLIKEMYMGWREVWAYSKTAVRRLNVNPSRIREIVELPTKKEVSK